jgi:predicted PurR-regulated permease PerM
LWSSEVRKDLVSELQKAMTGRRPLEGELVELAFRFGSLGFLIYWSYVLVRPFIAILVWSIVVAVALYPSYSWLAARLGNRRGLAAALTTFLVLLVIIGPATWLGLGLIEGLRTIAERLSSDSLTIPPPPAKVREWPLIGPQAFELWDLASTDVKAALAKIAPQLRPLGSSLLTTATSTGLGMLTFLVSVIIAGFLLAPGPSLVSAIKALSSRIISHRGASFVELAGATIRTVSRGVIGISVLQALLAGIGFMAADVPGASLLAFLV